MFTKLGKLSFVTVLLKNMGGNNDPGGLENDVIQDDNSKSVDSIIEEINNDDSNLITKVVTWLTEWWRSTSLVVAVDNHCPNE